MTPREPTAGEQLAIEELFKAAQLSAERCLFVHETGPGTFIVAGFADLAKAKPAGPPKATLGFWDDDSYPVFLDLFLDASGHFAEIDVWKASGTPILLWPVKREAIIPGDALYTSPGHG